MFILKSLLPGKMTAQDAINGARDGTLIVIDVREHAEVKASGKALGALHIPLIRLRDMADPHHPDFDKRLRQNTSIAVYCASGGRSMAARKILRQLGYDDVHNIGGLGGWLRAGGAVEAI